jgi:hypothetical protein
MNGGNLSGREEVEQCHDTILEPFGPEGAVVFQEIKGVVCGADDFPIKEPVPW